MHFLLLSSSRCEISMRGHSQANLKFDPRSRSGHSPMRLCSMVMPHTKRRALTRRTVWYHLQVFSTIMSWLLDKKRFMTSHDLRWPFPVPLSISGTRIITEEIIFHNTERIGWFWLAYTKQEAFQYFPIGLQCKGHESGLTSGHRYKNSAIYNAMHILVP